MPVHTGAFLAVLALVPTLGTAQHDLEQARSLMAEGRVDEALLVTDRLLKADAKHRGALLLAAEGNLRLMEQNNAGADFYLEDAARNLELALDLERGDADIWLKLADVRLKQSRFQDGEKAARRAIDILRKIADPGRAHRDRLAAAFLAQADNQLQRFVDVRRAEMSEENTEPRERTRKLAQAVLVSCNQALELGQVSEAARKSSLVFRWLEEPDAALRVLETGLSLEPADSDLHTAVQDLYLSMGRRIELVGAYRRLLREKDQPLVRWFLGRAEVAFADGLLQEGSHQQAAEAYATAEATFSNYLELRPQHTAATNHWIAICRLSRARCAFELGRLEDAESLFYLAYDATPAVVQVDANGYPVVRDCLGGNYLSGLFRIGQSLAEGGTIESLAASLALFDRFIERHPDEYGAAYNNAALTARDLGGLIARRLAGQPARGRADRDSMTEEQLRHFERATKLWEKAYSYYEKAVDLSPDDERIVNDCALMLVYHLHRDYDRARELFDRSIELGQAKLDGLPADASAQDRNDVSEAVGDAWQNIGVMLQDQGKIAEALPFYEKAVNYFPYERRGASRFAAEIRAKLSGNTGQDPVDAKLERFSPIRKKAEEAAASGDFDTALVTLDQSTAEFGDLFAFRMLAGDLNHKMAQQQIASGGSAGLIDGLFQDSISNYRKALEIDGESTTARRSLTRVLLDGGDSAGALAEAESLLSHGRSTGGFDTETLVDAHTMRAQAATRVYIEAKQAGEEQKEALNGARTSFRAIEDTGSLSAADRSTWITLEQWAGANDEALAIAKRGFVATGDPAGFVNLALQLGQADAAVGELTDREDGLGLWWRGRARYGRAMEQLRERSFDDASESLVASRIDFEAAGEANADYAMSSAEWASYCTGARGVTLAFAEKDAPATDALLQAIEENPAILDVDLGGWTPKQALDAIGARAVNRGLADAVEFFSRVSDALPTDVDFANNLGLFARDHAGRLDGDRQRKMYELSYRAYTRAQQIESENVRLCNDRALILVHYLDRDFDVARELLDRAVELGVVQHRNNPDDRQLEEALGDAYENLALLFIKQKKYDEARTAAQKSTEFFPGERRPGARAHLARIRRENGGGGR